MISMNKGKYHGVITPLITPFSENGEIDYDALDELLNSIVEAKINGFFVNATTGEFTSLSFDEKKKFASFVVSRTKEKAKIFMNVSSTDMREVFELCKYARQLQVDAVVSPPPYFLIPDKKGLKDYFLKIAEESNLDTLIYNIPGATGYNLPAVYVKELAEEEKRIIGVKATVDNLSYTNELIITIKEKRPEFSIFTGVEYYFLPNLISNGDGGIVALSNFSANIFVKLLHELQEQNLAGAKILHYKIMKLSQIYKYSSSFASAIKIALSLLGFKTKNIVRKPLSTDSEEARENIRKVLIETKLL
jgi:4-hydroxy-tetrahydrodipicolinate synthase